MSMPISSVSATASHSSTFTECAPAPGDASIYHCAFVLRPKCSIFN